MQSCKSKHHEIIFTADPIRRKILPIKGHSTRGRKPLLNRGDQTVIADVLASADNGNKVILPLFFLLLAPIFLRTEHAPYATVASNARVLANVNAHSQGLSRARVIELVQQVNPLLTACQTGDHFTRTLHKRASAEGILTKKAVKAQSTTAMRSMVSIEQQHRWHYAIESRLDKMSKENLPADEFQRLSHHFVLNYDEECFQAQGGIIKVIGSGTACKHETITAGRSTISCLKCGNAAGTMGPTIFLLSGKDQRPGFTNDWLAKQ